MLTLRSERKTGESSGQRRPAATTAGRLLLCLLLVAGLAGTGARDAAADAAPLQAVGRSLRPLSGTAVAMDGEEVTICLSCQPDFDPETWSRRGEPYLGRVKASFQFSCHQPQGEEVTVGFPLAMTALGRDVYWATRVEKFSVTVDGKPVAYEVRKVQSSEPALGEEDWAVWNMRFPAGVTRVEVEYQVPVGLYRPWSDLEFWYVLRTGAFWRGNVGRAIVHVRTDEPVAEADVVEATPGYRVEEGGITWDWRDLEPDFDLELRLKNVFLDAALRRAREGEALTLTDAHVLSMYLEGLDEYLMAEAGTDQEEAQALLDQAAESYRRQLRREAGLPAMAGYYNLMMHCRMAKPGAQAIADLFRVIDTGLSLGVRFPERDSSWSAELLERWVKVLETSEVAEEVRELARSVPRRWTRCPPATGEPEAQPDGSAETAAVPPEGRTSVQSPTMWPLGLAGVAVVAVLTVLLARATQRRGAPRWGKKDEGPGDARSARGAGGELP